MNYVVLYDDGVYWKVSKNNIKVHAEGHCTVKHRRAYYAGRIIFSSDTIYMDRLVENLNYGVPVILLNRCEDVSQPVANTIEPEPDLNRLENNNHNSTSFEMESEPDPFETNEDSVYKPADSKYSDNFSEEDVNQPEANIIELEADLNQLETNNHSNTAFEMDSEPDPFETDEDSEYEPANSDYFDSSCEEDVHQPGTSNHYEVEMERESKINEKNYYCQSAVTDHSYEGGSEREGMQSVPTFNRGEEKFDTVVEATNKKRKQNFCLYCKKLITQLPRHLERAHREKRDVNKFIGLAKGSYERREFLDQIRKKGNFIHNCDTDLNSGILISARRPGQRNRDPSSYTACPNCFGYYSKISIRKHFQNCCPKGLQGKRKLLSMSQQLTKDVSIKANDIVTNHIFPILRNDKITIPLRYDELVIIYANKMTTKYPKRRYYAMIRSRVRLIGRILFESKKLDISIKSFSDLFQPQKYDCVVAAINAVGKLDKEKKQYNAPSTASSAGTVMKKCANIYITELIKKQNKIKKEQVEDFLKLMDVDLGISVNRIVKDTQEDNRRLKVVNLPQMKDIKALGIYLKNKRQKFYNLLSQKFTMDYYTNLEQLTLTSVQVFNRRRAGEIQQIEVEDYKNYQTLQNNKDQDLAEVFSEECKDIKEYRRFTIRGKLGREVPVLLYKELGACIDLLLKYREQAGIPTTNPYLFAVSGTNNSYLDACSLMRQFSKKCGASNPSSLRGTTLRKHMATHSSLFDLNDNEISDLAKFMGHEEKIHRDHYRLPVATREITRISKLLEKAQGDIECGDDIEMNHSEEEVNDEEYVKARNMSMEKVVQKRSTSPMGTIRRRTWNQDEITVVEKHLSEYLSTGLLPSLEKCQQVIAGNKELQSRSPMQLKVWVNNQILKKKKSISPVKKITKIKRTHWSTPEKAIAYKMLKNNIDQMVLPSLNRCRQIIKENPVLEARTEVQLKLWVSNIIKKNRSKGNENRK